MCMHVYVCICECVYVYFCLCMCVHMNVCEYVCVLCENLREGLFMRLNTYAISISYIMVVQGMYTCIIIKLISASYYPSIL